jgi:hypothetical protein
VAKHRRRNGLLTKFTALLLIAALCAPVMPARRSEAAAGIDDIIIIIAIVMLEVVNYELKVMNANTTKDILGNVDKEFYYQGLIFAQQHNQMELEEELYELDHEPIENRLRVREELGLSSLYGSLSRAATNALSFLGSWDEGRFASASPGYRFSPGSPPVVYSEAYRERVEKIESYTKGMLVENSNELNSAAGTSVSNIGRLENAIMESGVFTGGGYRQTLQAENQTSNYSNVQMNRLRTDLARHADSTARFGLNEIQRKTDRVSAFEQAVGTWNAHGAGDLY